MACALAFMRNADEEAITMVIQNMASGLTGMICDGGNHGCTMKGIVAVDAAFRAADMADGWPYALRTSMESTGVPRRIP